MSTDRYLFFLTGEDTEYKFWSSDGTSRGTRILPRVELNATSRLATAGNVVFLGTSKTIHIGRSFPVAFREHTIWRTDGTPEATQLVRDPQLDSLLSTVELDLVPLNDRRLLFSLHNQFGEELWRLDLSATVIGDLNADSRVNTADFLALAANFGRTENVGLAEGDIDGDGDVDFTDFLLLAANWGRTG